MFAPGLKSFPRPDRLIYTTAVQFGSHRLSLVLWMGPAFSTLKRNAAQVGTKLLSGL